MLNDVYAFTEDKKCLIYSTILSKLCLGCIDETSGIALVIGRMLLHLADKDIMVTCLETEIQMNKAILGRTEDLYVLHLISSRLLGLLIGSS